MNRLCWVLAASSMLAWGCKCPAELPCALSAAPVVFAGTVVRTEPESWAAVLAGVLSRLEPELAAKYAAGWSPEEERRVAASLLSEEERKGLSESEIDEKVEEKYFRRTATLRVTESFRGVEAGTEVTLPLKAGGCAIPFETGDSYLVYADRGADGLLRTSLCYGTRLLADAAKHLEYLRAVASGRARARVYGVIALEKRTVERLPGIAVVLRDDEREFRTISDFEGRWEIDNLDAGTYELRTEMPGSNGPLVRTVTLSVGACSRQDWIAREGLR